MADEASTGVHDATAVGPVTVLTHAVAVYALLEDAGAGAQLATGTSVVTTGAGQLVVVYPFPDVGPDTTHEAAGTFVVLLVAQVVVV